MGPARRTVFGKYVVLGSWSIRGTDDNQSDECLAKKVENRAKLLGSNAFSRFRRPTAQLHFVLCKRKRLCYTLPAREHV
jgi:hypothetical protein